MTFLGWVYDKPSKGLYLTRKYEAYLACKEVRNSISVYSRNLYKTGLPVSDYPETPEGYSAFDPRLSEYLVEQYSQVGQTVLDPFFGWGTRLESCIRKHRKYVGFDVSPEAFGRVSQWLGDRDTAILYNDDGCALKGIHDKSIDMVLSCPPYWDLERYAKGVNQLSEASYEDFLIQMERCIRRLFSVLTDSGYVCFVMGSFRRDGKYVTVSEDLCNLFLLCGFIIHDRMAVRVKSKASRSSYRNAEHGTLADCNESVFVFKKP